MDAGACALDGLDGRACSTSARAPARSPSRSRTSIRSGRDGDRRTEEALALAAVNVDVRVSRCGWCADDLFGAPAGPWDLVVRTRRTWTRRRFATLQPEVRDWEPHGALTAEGAVEAVARGAVAVLASGGVSRSRSGRVRRRRRSAARPGWASWTVRVSPIFAGSTASSRAAGFTDATSVVASIGNGELVVLRRTPSTALSAPRSTGSRRADLDGLKGRDVIEPTASRRSVDELLEDVPGSGAGRGDRARAAAGPVHARRTEPAARFGWLSRAAGDGRRSCAAPRRAGAGIVERLGAIVATSANLPVARAAVARGGARRILAASR